MHSQIEFLYTFYSHTLVKSHKQKYRLYTLEKKSQKYKKRGKRWSHRIQAKIQKIV